MCPQVPLISYAVLALDMLEVWLSITLVPLDLETKDFLSNLTVIILKGNEVRV